ncbi:TadE/TadG family type IV pilus assembly protein [Colwellia psychrerythraea]|uniref:TadE/TadG family type IV pilus assembly protein n=1 Tax=Colwellia psychrerythraea TaxID=28229 RepID=UPI001E3A51D4|nr:TadE/TadG family type IV pilus assembly protein [Colwellia psychrerythraea]
MNMGSWQHGQHKRTKHYKQRGSMVLEVAFLLPIFLFIVFSALELARGLILYASLNHVVSEAARQVKLSAASGANYQGKLLQAIKANPASLLDSSKLMVEQAKFYSSPEELANQEANNSVVDKNGLLAKYSVSYQVTLLSPWLQDLFPFSADILVKHEPER